MEGKTLEDEIYNYIRETRVDPNIDKKKLAKIIIATVLGSGSAYVSAKILPRVMNDIRAIDINNLRSNPQDEVKKLVERLKQDGIEVKQEIGAEFNDIRTQGVVGYTSNQVERLKEEYFLNLFQDNYCYPSELKIEGIDVIIGAYLSDRPIKRPEMERIRKFVTALRLDNQALPTYFGYEKGFNSEIRKMILRDFTGYATTDIDGVIDRLNYIQEHHHADDELDTTLTRCELDMLHKYKDKIQAKAEGLDDMV